MSSVGSGGGPPRSFWTTLPGILTGVAAVIAALGGLIGGLAAAGVFKESSQPIVVVVPTATAPAFSPIPISTVGSTSQPTTAATAAQAPTATVIPLPVDTPTFIPTANPIPTSTKVPVPISTLSPVPTLIDISGTWFYADGFVEFERVPSTDNQYTYQDYNLFGQPVEEGVAFQSEGRLDTEGVNFLFGQAAGDFEIVSRSVMQGIVCSTIGCSPITLSR